MTRDAEFEAVHYSTPPAAQRGNIHSSERCLNVAYKRSRVLGLKQEQMRVGAHYPVVCG